MCGWTPSRWTWQSPAPGAELVARVDELGVDVEYLVNNAGVGILGLTVQDSDPAAVSRMVQLNVVTTTDLTLLYAGRMVKAGRGAILNVGSIAAYVIPHGLEAGYAASKAFVRSFSECVADDLRGTGVTCTHLAPGPTRTEFMHTAGLGDTSRLDRYFMDAAPVAKAGYAAMRAGRVNVIPGVGTKIMRAMSALSPSRASPPWYRAASSAGAESVVEHRGPADPFPRRKFGPCVVKGTGYRVDGIVAQRQPQRRLG